MRPTIAVLMAIASIFCRTSAAQPPTKFDAITPSVTVGETVPGVWGCPYARAPDCERASAFNAGLLTMPASVPIRMADPYRHGGHCSLDSVNGQPAPTSTLRVSRQAPLRVAGWAFNDVRMPDETNFVLATSAVQYRAPVARRTLRPDVAEYFKIPSLVDAGYDGDLNLQGVPNGTYDVYILMRIKTAVTMCHPGQKLQITSE
ncbi:hypothetical protein [Caballeronia cordobensis]|uniref:hypothetical protein n=1 Tax=Caballeronia cordobensis TaxID=1353886 RepID=UPI00045EFAFA|nr:putative membrane protein [Burkholderia sp. RPE67]